MLKGSSVRRSSFTQATRPYAPMVKNLTSTVSKLFHRRYLISGLLAFVLVSAGWFAWTRFQDHSSDAAVLDTQTVGVRRQDITVEVSAAGTIKALTPVNISPKQSGRLATLFVEQGDRVRAGQVLARMDDTNLQGQLLEAQGNLASARANLDKLKAGNRPQERIEAEENLREAQANLIAAHSTYESNQKLYAGGAVSKNTLDSSRSTDESIRARIRSLQALLDLSRAGYRKEEIEQARAQVTTARGQLQSIQATVDDTVIRAPFAGIITQKYASPGAFVTPTTTATTTNSATSSSILALASDLEAVVNVAEADIRNLRVGQTATIQVDAYPGRTFRGRVRLIAPEAVVTQNVTSFEVRVRILDDRTRQLRSGMNITTNFLVGRARNALLVPTIAVVTSQQGTSVFVPGSQGRPEVRSVRIGVTVGTDTQVLAGLRDDDRVFITQPGRRQPNATPPSNSGSPFRPPRPPS